MSQTDTPEANLRKNARDLLRIQRRFMYAKREDLALVVKELRDRISEEITVPEMEEVIRAARREGGPL